MVLGLQSRNNSTAHTNALCVQAAADGRTRSWELCQNAVLLLSVVLVQPGYGKSHNMHEANAKFG